VIYFKFRLDGNRRRPTQPRVSVTTPHKFNEDILAYSDRNRSAGFFVARIMFIERQLIQAVLNTPKSECSR
jgi:hypothetical protein